MDTTIHDSNFPIDEVKSEPMEFASLTPEPHTRHIQSQEVYASVKITERTPATHMKTHTGEKKHQCEICTKCFTTRTHLSTHMRIHADGEKRYKCEVCAKFFRAKCHLSRHTMIHTGERNYECEKCSRCFARKGDLSNHMNVHTGEKIHKCEICSKCFIRKDNLLCHVNIHFRENNCEICCQRFKTRENFTSHMKLHALFLGGKKLYVEENPLRKVPYEKVATSIKKEKLDIDSDVIVGEPTADNDLNKLQEKLKLTEMFNVWKTCNSEIIIKEETVVATT